MHREERDVDGDMRFGSRLLHQFESDPGVIRCAEKVLTSIVGDVPGKAHRDREIHSMLSGSSKYHCSQGLRRVSFLIRVQAPMEPKAVLSHTSKAHT